MNWLIGAIVALVILCGMQTYRLQTMKAAHAEYVAQIEGEARIAEAAARQEEQRRQTAIDKVRSDAQTQKAADDAAAAQLVADGKLLRDQANRLLADRAALNTRLAARGKTINDLTDLLAQLRTEADDHAGELATALDASRRAGFACERSYDTLRNEK